MDHRRHDRGAAALPGAARDRGPRGPIAAKGGLNVDRVRRHVALMIVPLAVLALGLFVSVLVPYAAPLRWLAFTTPLDDLSPFLVIHAGAGLLAASIVLALRRGSPPGLASVVIAVLAILTA